jgi:hypothetical protein
MSLITKFKENAMKDNEPTLESIEDYNDLKGPKKRGVWIVILSGLLIGAIFLAVKSYYGEPKDSVKIEDTISKVPLK